MPYDFETLGDRRGGGSGKWKTHGQGVLPGWVADMDFVSAEPLLRALRERGARGFHGYTQTMIELGQTIRMRLKKLPGWGIRGEGFRLAEKRRGGIR